MHDGYVASVDLNRSIRSGDALQFRDVAPLQDIGPG